MKAFKLTDKNGQTKNNTQWGENITHSATGQGTDLCSDGWIHFYMSPLLAAFMNPAHANFTNPILWECECSGEMIHKPDKSGCKTLTTICKVELPSVTITQQIAFGILAAKATHENTTFNNWADKWLSGEDRTKEAAYATYAAAYAAYNYAATAYAAYAAYNYAAYAAAYAAYNYAATAFAANAATAAGTIKLQVIAEEAMKY